MTTGGTSITGRDRLEGFAVPLPAHGRALLGFTDAPRRRKTS